MSDDTVTLETTGTETNTATNAPTDGSEKSTQDRNDERDLLAWKNFERIAERHEAQDGTEPDEATTDARAESNPDDDGETDTDDAEGATEGNASKQPELPEGAEDAIKAMSLDGMSEEVIAKLLQDDPDYWIKEYASKRIKSQKDVSRKLSERAKSAPRDEPGTQPDKSESKVEAPKDFIEAAKAAIDEAMSGVESADIFVDDEAGKQLLGVLTTSALEQMGRYVTEQLAARDRQLAELNEHISSHRADMLNREIEQARQSLSEKYPDLTSDEAHQGVLEKYDLIVEAVKEGDAKYKSAADVYEDAAKWYFSDSNPANAVKRVKETMFKKMQSQRRATPRGKTAAPKDSENLTVEQKAWMRFNRIADKHEGVNSR